MNWKLKAAVQKAISIIPGKTVINRQLQRITGGLALEDQQFQWKIEHARDHLKYYQGHCQVDLSSARVLELGTGWYPIVPIYFYLQGCRSFDSIDIYQWIKVENYHATISMYKSWREQGRLEEFISELNEERWNVLMDILDSNMSVEQINQRIFFNPIVGDASSSPKLKPQYDMVCSNNVLEHIYPEYLEPILARFHDSVKPGGLMSHFIDLSDHFAHGDGRITIYNFLAFSDRQWRWIDNDIQPQNRMRWPQYIEMFENIGIPCSVQDTRPGSPEAFGQLKIHECFQGYSPEGLMISHGQIVSHY